MDKEPPAPEVAHLSFGPPKGFWLMLSGWVVAVLAVTYAVTEYSEDRGTKAISQAPAAHRQLETIQMTPTQVERLVHISKPQPVAGPSPQAGMVATVRPLYVTGPRPANGNARLIDPDELHWLQDRLNEVHRGVADPADLTPALALIKEVGSMTYHTEFEGWIDPAIIDQRRYGDCAAKSYWLAVHLLQAGYRNVALVKGVQPGYQPGMPGHAWVELWFHGDHFVFEPANSVAIYIPETAPTKNYEVIFKVYRGLIWAPSGKTWDSPVP